MKVVVLDIDGVLAPCNEPISDEVSRILRAISEKTQIVFASGKTTQYLEGLARGIGLSNVIVIGENGAVVSLPKIKIEEKFSLSENEKNVICTMRQELLMKSCGMCWLQPNEIVLTAFPLPPFKTNDIYYVCENVLNRSNARNYMRLIRHSDSVDCLPSRLDKSLGVEAVSRILRISTSDFISVGDNPNSDMGMLNISGTSIFIGNKSDHEVQEKVKNVTKIFETGIAALNYIYSTLNPNSR